MDIHLGNVFSLTRLVRASFMPDHNFLTKRHHTSLSFLSIHSQNIWEILSRAVGLFLFHVFKVAFSASLLPVFIDLCVSKGAFYFFFLNANFI